MRKFGLLAALAAGATVALSGAAMADWKPNKPIRIIVPWGAGGSTDQQVRAIAPVLEEGLGQKVVVVNQPGGGGSIGTKSALEADKDGYTWTAGAVKDLATYPVTGKLDTKVQDWHLYFTIANMTLVSVHPDAPYKDFGDFLKAMKSDPSSVSVATAGVPSSGHSAIESIKTAAGGDYKLVNYDGGNPAVKSTVSGETVAVPQLLSEQIEFIRAKRLRPLAVLKGDTLTIDGYGDVPSITKWLPDFKAGPIHFGIWAPKGIPADVVAKMDQVWAKVATSQVLKDYAYKKGLAVTPYFGKEALERAWPVIAATAWGYQAAGKAVVSPDTVGIPKP